MNDRPLSELLHLLSVTDAANVIVADVYAHAVSGSLQVLAANLEAFKASPLKWQAGVGRIDYDPRRFRRSMAITRGELETLLAAGAANETATS